MGKVMGEMHSEEPGNKDTDSEKRLARKYSATLQGAGGGAEFVWVFVCLFVCLFSGETGRHPPHAFSLERPSAHRYVLRPDWEAGFPGTVNKPLVPLDPCCLWEKRTFHVFNFFFPKDVASIQHFSSPFNSFQTIFTQSLLACLAPCLHKRGSDHQPDPATERLRV